MTLLLTRLMLFFQDRFARDERGATTVEYGMLVLVLIGIVTAAGVLLSGKISDLFSSISFD